MESFWWKWRLLFQMESFVFLLVTRTWTLLLTVGMRWTFCRFVFHMQPIDFKHDNLKYVSFRLEFRSQRMFRSICWGIDFSSWISYLCYYIEYCAHKIFHKMYNPMPGPLPYGPIIEVRAWFCLSLFWVTCNAVQFNCPLNLCFSLAWIGTYKSLWFMLIRFWLSWDKIHVCMSIAGVIWHL